MVRQLHPYSITYLFRVKMKSYHAMKQTGEYSRYRETRARGLDKASNCRIAMVKPGNNRRSQTRADGYL